MNNKFVGFNLLKQAVSIERVFERYGLLERFHRSGDNLTGACPIHGGHNRSQFRVSLTRNLWICFGDCQGGGSILDFVSRMEGTSVREAGLMIQDWFGVDGSRPMVQQAVLPDEVVSANPVLGAELGGLDPEHPYLKERGLNGETIATFGLGHCRKGWLAGWIAIPIRNTEGELVAFAGRWPGIPSGEQPRYRVPRGFHKSWELFNLHRARNSGASGGLPRICRETRQSRPHHRDEREGASAQSALWSSVGFIEGLHHSSKRGRSGRARKEDGWEGN